MTSVIPQVQPQQNIDFSQFGNYSDSAKQAIQNGASLQDVQQAYQKIQPQQQAKPNFLERMLPTAGGILGGIAGTFVSPILGSAAGAGVGGALGQELENKLTGDKQSTLTSGIENGVGGLLGGVGGKALEAGAGALSGAAEKGAAKLFAAQGPGLGEDISKIATKTLGINDLPTAAKFGEVLSGSTDATSNPDKGLLSKFVADQADQNNTKVDLTDLQPAVPGSSQVALKSQAYAASRNIGNNDNPLVTEQLISKNGLKQDDADAIRKQVQGVLGRPENAGSVSQSDLLGMQKQISGMAAEASDAAQMSRASSDVAKANVLNGINQNLKTRLGFDNMKIDTKTAKSLADDVLINASPVHQNAAQVIAKQITDQANSDEGLTVAQVRNMESNMVQLQNSAKDAIAAKDRNFGTSTSDLTKASLPLTGAVAGGNPSGVLGAVIGKATASPTADKFASQGFSTLGKTLSKGSEASTGLQKGLGITNKDAGLINKILPVATRAGTVAAANIPNIASSGTPPAGSNPQNNVTSLTGTNNMQAQSQTTQPQGQDLASVLNNLLTQAQASPLAAGNDSAIITALAPLVQKQNAVQAILGNLGNSFQNAGGARGLGGGALSSIASLIPGTAQNQYINQQKSAAQTLQQLYGIPASTGMGLLPQFMQNGQTAGISGGNVSNILGSIGQ